MGIPWNKEQKDTLREMREAGKDWDEIAECVGHSPDSCRTRAYTDDVKKWGRKSLVNHEGSILDEPEMYRQVNTRPLAKQKVMRPCIGCKRQFLSWDRAKNQRCQKCAAMNDSNIAY